MKIILLLYLASLPAKEVLTYDVNLGPLYAGEMKLSFIQTTFEGQPCYRFRSVLSSLEGLAWLFTLNDTIYSYVTRDSFKVLYVEKRMHETNYDTVIRVRFDWETNRILYEDGSSYPLLPGTLDVVSIYYFFRLNPLAVGEERDVVLHADRMTERASVQGVKEVAVRSQASPTGSFVCTKLAPDVRGKGSFGSGGNLIFYLTNDENLYPALIRTVMTIGSISARLKWIWFE